THPDWLPGARLNIAESCFRAEPGKTAIVCASEAFPELRHVTYGELHRLASGVANGLSAAGTKPGDRVALYLPMTLESVGIYLGVVLAGCCVVGIADASAPADFAKRSGIAGAKLVFTVDAYLRDGKEHPVYGKVTAADGPRAVVLGMDPETPARTTRPKDLRCSASSRSSSARGSSMGRWTDWTGAESGGSVRRRNLRARRTCST